MKMLNNLEIRIEVDKLKRAIFDLEVRVKYLEYLNRFKQVPIGEPLTDTGDFYDRIFYGNGVFVANTESGHDIMVYSGDGIHWYESLDRVEGTPCNFAYHNGIFIAVGTEKDTIYYSYDGIRWEKNENMSNMGWLNVIYGDKFVVFGHNDPHYAWSKDGINWEIGINNAGNNNPEYMIYGNGVYIGWKHDGSNFMVYSKDGKTWERSPYNITKSISDMIYKNSIYVATNSNETPHFMYSKNGIDWSLCNDYTEKPEVNWYSLGCSNNMFVCSGIDLNDNRKVYFAYSKNGIDWYLGTSTFENQTTQIIYANNKFVGICVGPPYVVYSKNGIDWYGAEGLNDYINPNMILDGIVYGNDRFVIVSENFPTFCYSDDGIHWKPYDGPMPPPKEQNSNE